MLDAIPGVQRGRRCTGTAERGFCCGAGGARMWMEERIGKRVNVERTDEALGTGAELIATSCPYCLIMLDDAVNQRRSEGKVNGVKVIDIAQVLADSIGLQEGPGDGRCARRRGGRVRRPPAAAARDVDLDRAVDRGPPDGPTVVDPSDRHADDTEKVKDTSTGDQGENLGMQATPNPENQAD